MPTGVYPRKNKKVKVQFIKQSNNLKQRWESLKIAKKNILSFLNEREKIYNSPIEAYIDGYLEG